MISNKQDCKIKYFQEGFTLIELMVVIAIVGVLMAMAVPQYGNYLDKASVRACEGELASYRNMVLANSSLSQSSDVIQPNDYHFQSCKLENDQALAEAFAYSQDYEGEIYTNRTGAGSLEIRGGNIVRADS